MSVNKNRYNNFIQGRGAFAMIPNEIWETDLDHTAKVIWCYLVSRSPGWDSSRNNLARNLNLGKDTVSAYIDQLTTRNMVIVTVGEKKSWSFEINPPSEWTGLLASPDLNTSGPIASPSPDFREVQYRTSGRSTPKKIRREEEGGRPNSKQFKEEQSKSTQHPSCPVDQSEQSTLSLNGGSNRQPHALGAAVKKNAPERDSVVPARRPFSAIYGGWIASLPDGKVPSKERAQYFYTLFANLRQGGHNADSISPTMRDRIIALAVPARKPNTMESDRYDSWRQQVESDYDVQLATVMYAPSGLQMPDSLNPEFRDMSPAAIRHYKEFMAIPESERPALPYSVREYALQQEIAEGFTEVK